ncbi:MAG: GntR family transcriptional regulator [Clostridium sp.]
MIFEIDHHSKIPVYGQIADWIERQIKDGTLKEGQRLPAERKMCSQTGAARNTVKRAYEELAKRGLVITEQNSGSYIKKQDFIKEEKKTERMAAAGVQKLRELGISRHETEHLFLKYIWNHLPEAEKVKTAWVDCSVEILQDTAKEIEKFCNTRVTPLLLDDVLNNGDLLANGGYDIVATTINHFDDILHISEKRTGNAPSYGMDMVVLAVSQMSVSRIAKIEPDMRVIVIYEDEWYRYSIERYLQEFAVKGKIKYITMEEAMNYLIDNNDKKAVILPQDFSFREGLIQEIFDYCMSQNIVCFPFQQIIDHGSLLHLKKQIQEQWMKKDR